MGTCPSAGASPAEFGCQIGLTCLDHRRQTVSHVAEFGDFLEECPWRLSCAAALARNGARGCAFAGVLGYPSSFDPRSEGDEKGWNQ